MPNTNTGRKFIYDDLNAKVVEEKPSHDEWHEWEEWRDEDGDLWWSSDDPDGYILSAEEFWGGEEPNDPYAG